MRMKLKFWRMFVCTLCAIVLLVGSAHAAPDNDKLVIASHGLSSYQIVIPDSAADKLTERWLEATAKLMQAAFKKSGFDVPVVGESDRTTDAPSIYLGATDFAHNHDIQPNFDDWTYVSKVIGKNLVIAGNDHQDPNNKSIALLGTVKGACDFMREHLGVRFLFHNFTQGPTPVNADGSLDIDTRSIEFLPLKQVAVKADLDLQKSPMMRAFPAANRGAESFYLIANNFFPMLSSVRDAIVDWNDVIALKKYAQSHPEYFALLANGKRTSDKESGYIPKPEGQETPLNVTHSDVQTLMVRAIEEKIRNGSATVLISPPDAYALDRCNCDSCNRLFGMTAKNWHQVYARGRTGKLWKIYFSIADRVYQKYPEARIVVWNYQDTPIDSPFIRKIGAFPKNLIPKVQYTSAQNFAPLKGISIPAGIAGLGETFTGFGVAGSYTPQRTPEYIAGVVKLMARYKMQWSTLDGDIGYVRGMQAPAHYVYGRMIDDPSADWHSIYQEFLTAAFGNVASNMKAFFNLQHKQLALYSNYLNWGQPAFGLAVEQGNKWTFLNIYTPEYLDKANSLLTTAQRNARNPDVKARLHLIRIEFNYLRGLAKILILQNAWEVHPTQSNLTPILDEVDEWHAMLNSLIGKDGGTFNALNDWPQMRPFSGHAYIHASLMAPKYHQSGWPHTAINWDTKTLRGGILTDPNQIKVPAVELTPKISSRAWDDAPTVVLREHQGMPLNNVRTTLKVLRDQKNLYVRMQSLYPSVHPERLIKPKTEEGVLKQEHVGLSFQPKTDGPIYHLMINPVKEARYDAVLQIDEKGVMTTNMSWDGSWQYAYHVTGHEGKWNLSRRIWTAWFTIPFASLDMQAPASGDTWKFNAARSRGRRGNGQYLLWSNGSSRSITNSKTMGSLEF